ncbi:SDR family NAD(P)-dependent oxidoreductase [Leptospira ilyithenensis]|uniref:SDR family NAD(P)-dependent oxidoreductase n=1 Tax=Leptospira ilyithenensis TaxID=2484901 RepID=A0A4R9LQ23_9LEPT|nr:SDR family NAD(P)-dependent oxidoreductase [Leptospira ilyithenensis]TGN10246.1 SDR family NAD(P)-dependent oxidoreductase [Leptospira ilyithenensis]
MDYKNKTILITGASSGIGRELAIVLADFGNNIVVTARRENLLQDLKREIEDKGSKCLFFAGDATDPKHADLVVRETTKTFGKIDIAILNVGVGPASNTIKDSREVILGKMRTNYDTLINFFVPVIAQMKSQTTPCMIAHLNSLATYFGIPMQGDYTAAKAAGRIFLDTARMELKHFGFKHVRIQTIHPGFVATEAVKDDGIPAPNEISEKEAVKYILNGLRREVHENRFPFSTALAVRIGRLVPTWLRTKILLSEAAADY